MFTWLKWRLPSYKYKREINRLETELVRVKADNEKLVRINDRIKKSDLPFCESKICSLCGHAEKQSYYALGQHHTVLIGCRKDFDCKDFVRIKE